jgi:FlaA1/EpsC-like NDP-sugar epimerase
MRNNIIFDIFIKFFKKISFYKTAFLILIDVIICNTSIFIAMYLRLDFFYPLLDISHFFLISSSLLLIFILFMFDIYKTLNRYSGWEAFIQLGKALLIYDILMFSVCTLFGIENVPRAIGVIQPIILTLMILSSRIAIRIFLGDKFKTSPNYKENVLIYGAGVAGRQLAQIILYSKKMTLLGFLEDNKKLIGSRINNQIIYDAKKLTNIKKKLNINTIFLAIPSLSNNQKSIILQNIQKNKIGIKTLPTLSELENKNISFDDLRPLNIEELLGRKPVDTSFKKKNNYINNNIVLVTGAGGSIGSELCQQVIIQNPTKLIILDSSEYNLYKIQQELNERFKTNVIIVPILCSVINKNAIENLFANHRPNIIYHAAAYKHVPLVQSNPIEGLKNNVFGTKIIADLCLKYEVKKFVLISSDKAVRPTNIMGASKRLAELYLQSLNTNSKKTIFTMVRFGNVLGSSGSVIPKFHNQILTGAPLTLTHEKVTRFFMTAKEAIHLIIEAGYLAKGGEVFVLKMGKSIKIIDLAKKMIFLSGKTLKDKNNPKGDIEIIITGLRPGEKLYEEVLVDNNPMPTPNKKIFKATEKFFSSTIIDKNFNTLETNMRNNKIKEIDLILKNLIPGYKNEGIKN